MDIIQSNYDYESDTVIILFQGKYSHQYLMDYVNLYYPYFSHYCVTGISMPEEYNGLFNVGVITLGQLKNEMSLN